MLQYLHFTYQSQVTICRIHVKENFFVRNILRFQFVSVILCLSLKGPKDESESCLNFLFFLN